MSMLMALGATVQPVTVIEDVFQAYTRTGTGASATITTGIDLSTKAGLVWTKRRSAATSHKITDTKRGATKAWSSDSTAADSTDTQGLTAFGATGYTIGTDTNYNNSGATYVDWTMREAANFLSITQYTGDNTSTGRTISHTLGTAPGMVIIVGDNLTLDHYVWHRSTTSGNYLKLNTTAAQSSTLANTFFGDGTITVDPTSSVVTVGLGLNVLSDNYTMYCFGHDTSANGLIQCGSFTTDGSGSMTPVTVNWETQYLIYKNITSGGEWAVCDSARALGALGVGGAGQSNKLVANTSAAEIVANNEMYVTATTFSCAPNQLTASKTYIYLAIRRGPMKLPTVGTQVYNAIAYTGTGAQLTNSGVGFPPDMIMGHVRAIGSNDGWAVDRLRGRAASLYLDQGSPEFTSATATNDIVSFNMDGATIGLNNQIDVNQNTLDYINWFFRRYPGVCDEVCYPGTGANKTETHNLTAAPELWMVKGRSETAWTVGCTALANTEYLVINTIAAKATDATAWNSTFPTSTALSLGTQATVNTNTATYVAYLFATLAGISKVGSYTGNGTSQNLNMGFSGNARFFLCKCTSTDGDWLLWDSTRGINGASANDPHLSINITAEEVNTTNDVEPFTTGITVVQNVTTNINVNAAKYIYLAFS